MPRKSRAIRAALRSAGRQQEGQGPKRQLHLDKLFYSYLAEHGRAGFVMSSQASAGRDEAKVRQKLIETGDVDVMVAIRPNFFYTRAVPCELWFFSTAPSL